MAGAETSLPRIAAHLAGGACRIAEGDARAVRLVDGRGGAIVVDPAALARMAREGAIVRDGDRIALARGVARGGAPAPRLNTGESPLAALAARRDRNGRLLLSAREVEAGERLRADFTCGRIMPATGQSWNRPAGRVRGSGERGGAADLTDAALAARQRVDRAIAAVGPELSGVLLDICCFLKGLELVEIERGWPVRSAKIVLKTALGVLARHYWPENPRREARMLHWGAEDFRPTKALPGQP